MATNNWRPPQVREPSMDAGNWGSQLQLESRQRIVNMIMDTLKRHFPCSGQESSPELKKIAVRFEEMIYTAATSESDYFEKIALKIYSLETRSQNAIENSSPMNSAGNINRLPDPGCFGIQPQVPNQGLSLSMPLSANQSQSHQQLLSQNIQNNIPPTGVQSSARLSSALPSSGLTQTPISSTVGQNPNIKNMSVTSQNSFGNSMGQGVPSHKSASSQRQMQGMQQVVLQQQQQHQSQNSQQYMYHQQLQHPLLKPKSASNFLLTQQSQPQALQQQLLSQIQSQPTQMQHLVLQQQSNPLERDMQHRLQASGQVSGTVLQTLNVRDQQKQLYQSQSFLSETSSNSTAQTGHATRGDWQEVVYQKQSQTQITQVQPHENQMNPQLQSINIQGSVATMQQNNMTRLEQNPVSSLLGFSSTTQFLQAASPKISQHSSPQNDQQNLLAHTKAGTSSSPFVIPSPSTPMAPSSMPGDSEKPSSLSNAEKIGHLQATGVGSQIQSLAIGTPGISASPLLAEFSVPDSTHVNALSTISGKSNVTKQPLERLIKAVNSMSSNALSASVSDIGSVVSMSDRIAGSAPGKGSSGEDLITMTKCCLQGRNVLTRDATNGSRKMRRFTSAVPLNVVQSAGNDSFRQLASSETSDLESTATYRIKRPRIEANHALLEEIREIRQRLINTVVDISDEDDDPSASAADGGKGTIFKCFFDAVAFGPNLKSQYASAQMSPIQPLRLLVPSNYPNCSPILLDKFPVEVSKEYEDLSVRAKSRFSISLRSISQPMSLGEIARTWDVCAYAVISEHAQQSGGGSFSSKYGTWENCLSAA